MSGQTVEYSDRLITGDYDKHRAAQKVADEKHNVTAWNRKGQWHRTYLEAYFQRKIISLDVKNIRGNVSFIDVYYITFEDVLTKE